MSAQLGGSRVSQVSCLDGHNKPHDHELQLDDGSSSPENTISRWNVEWPRSDDGLDSSFLILLRMPGDQSRSQPIVESQSQSPVFATS